MCAGVVVSKDILCGEAAVTVNLQIKVTVLLRTTTCVRYSTVKIGM